MEISERGRLLPAAKFAPLESSRRLSASLLWTWQRNFFESRGMDAWTAGTVPHHITCSPFMADAYARILFGHLRDHPPEPGEPVYIVELGAGSGRLGYLVLDNLLERLKQSALRDIRIKYVLTDFTQRNVDYWRGHGWLQTFIEEGVLDMARFDAQAGEVLQLSIGGETLCAETLRNPLMVIANYVFDGIPQDAFRVREGELFETLIEVSSPQHEPALEDPDVLARAEFSYRHEPAAADYYAEPEWNAMLDGYRRRLPAADFLFPVAALRCIGSLDRMSGGRFALISADRGYHSDSAMLRSDEGPQIFRHGSFSMPVDYQLIGEYFARRGGLVLHPPHPHNTLNISMFGLHDTPHEWMETRMAYGEAIGKFGPDDFSTLKEAVDGFSSELTLDQIIAFLRLSAWDYLRFWNCLPALHSRIQDATEGQKWLLCQAVRNIWNSYFPIGEVEDLPFQMGALLLEMECFGEALEYFTHSVGLYGEAYGTVLNKGLCYFGLGQVDLSRECIGRALELYPESEAARNMLIELGS